MKLKDIEQMQWYWVKSRARLFKNDAYKMRGKKVQIVSRTWTKGKQPHRLLVDADGNKYDPSNLVPFSCDEVTCEKCPLYGRDKRDII